MNGSILINLFFAPNYCIWDSWWESSEKQPQILVRKSDYTISMN